MDAENTLENIGKNSTVSISSELKERIRSHGKMGDSFNTVLNKIMDDYETIPNGDD